MKAEDAGDANCHIGIAGEIEVHLQGVENYTVPDTQCGLGGEVVPQELVYDAGEPVCQHDLLPRPTAMRPKPMLRSSADTRRWCRSACMVSYRAIGPEMVIGKRKRTAGT